MAYTVACSPKVNSNSPFVDQPIHTFTFPGSTNTTYQTVIKVHSTKEGLHQVCTHIGYGIITLS